MNNELMTHRLTFIFSPLTARQHTLVHKQLFKYMLETSFFVKVSDFIDTCLFN